MKHESINALLELADPDNGAKLVGIYFQVSSRYRMVAKLPDGMTGQEALRSVTPKHRWDWVENMGEASAGDFFLRVYSKEKLDLSRAQWEQYKAAGGRTYR